MGGFGGHHLDALPRRQLAVDHAHICHDTPVAVVDRVEDHRTGRSLRIPHGSRDEFDDPVQELLDAHAGLARHAQHVLRLAADERRELGRVLLRVGRRQVDLVEHRDDRQVVLEREIQVRERLGFDALRGVHQQDGPLARGKGPGHLVGEVDVAGSVDHVQGERA